MAMIRRRGGVSFKVKPEARPALAGLLGGSLSTMVLHPLDVLKTKQAVFGGSASKLATASGLNSLYRGIAANVLVSSTSWAIYFTRYIY